MRTLTITTAEWASVQDGTLWLVREGVPCATPHSCPKFTRQMCRWGGIHPPAEFVQACAPCETCHNTTGSNQQHGEFTRWDLLTCPDCRIELVGPCLVCQDTLEHYKLPDRMYCSHTRKTLGYAYAVGPPLPIYTPASHPIGTVDHLCFDRTLVVVVNVHEGVETDITDRLAHYGPPELLVGKWALHLAVAA